MLTLVKGDVFVRDRAAMLVQYLLPNITRPYIGRLPECLWDLSSVLFHDCLNPFTMVLKTFSFPEDLHTNKIYT